MSTERFASSTAGSAATIPARTGGNANGRPRHASSMRRVPAARNRSRKIEPLEPAVERAAAQAEHLRRGLLVAAGAHERALDVIALDVDEQIGAGLSAT